MKIKHWIIQRLGGYSSIFDAIEGTKEQTGYTRHDILTLAVKRLFNTIGKDDILQIDESNQWVFQGKVMSTAEKNLLISEARQLINTKLWKVLKADIAYQANKRMYVESRSLDDLVLGKSWIYVLDAIETRLKSMEKGNGLYNFKK